ncbi:MAG: hypothetical protein Q7S96_03560 [bacterium]|nr:hypothetical protein [bacterium]
MSTRTVKSTPKASLLMPILVIVAVLTGGAAIAFVATGTLRSPVVRDPQGALDVAWESALDATSVHTRARVVFSDEGPGAGPSGIITYDGTSQRDGDASSSDGIFTIALAKDADTLEAVLDFRSFPDAQYVRLTELSMVGDSPQPRASASAIQLIFGGRWVLVDGESIAALQETFAPSSSAVPFVASASPQALTELRTVARAHRPFRFVGDLGRERVDDTWAQHLRVTLDPDAMRVIIPAVLGVLDRDGAARWSRDAEGLLPDVIGETESDVWLTRRGGELVRMHIPLASPAGTAATRVGIELSWSAWNVPVTIVAPESALPLEEFLIVAFGRSAAARAAMGQPDADGDGLTDRMEELYRSDSNNPDSDGDGYTDGDEVTNGYSPVGPDRL